jgi:hypothetical protein
MEELRKEAAAALERAARDMKKYYDRSHQPPPNFNLGDRVLLEGANLKTNRPSKKLDHRRFGPFVIMQKVGERAYRLKLPASWRVHPVFHVSNLLPYRHDDHSLSEPPPPDLVEGELEQEVEDILADRIRRGKKQYFVKWRGFPMEESEWKTAEELKHAPDLLKRYEDKHKSNLRTKSFNKGRG